MANYICNVADVRSTNYNRVLTVVLPFGSTGEELEFKQGDQIAVGALVDANRRTYEGTIVADAQNEVIGTIINQDVYADEFGNKTGLMQNPAKIKYRSGKAVAVIVPEDFFRFVMTNDCINGTPVAGQYLVPVNGEQQLTPSAANTGYKLAYEVLKVNDTASIHVNGRPLACTIVRAVRA